MVEEEPGSLGPPPPPPPLLCYPGDGPPCSSQTLGANKRRAILPISTPYLCPPTPTPTSLKPTHWQRREAAWEAVQRSVDTGRHAAALRLALDVVEADAAGRVLARMA